MHPLQVGPQNISVLLAGTAPYAFNDIGCCDSFLKRFWGSQMMLYPTCKDDATTFSVFIRYNKSGNASNLVDPSTAHVRYTHPVIGNPWPKRHTARWPTKRAILIDLILN